MTRGQESLAIELEQPRVAADVQVMGRVERAALIVLRATEAELAEHARVLQGIAKDSKSGCVWLTEAPAG